MLLTLKITLIFTFCITTETHQVSRKALYILISIQKHSSGSIQEISILQKWHIFWDLPPSQSILFVIPKGEDKNSKENSIEVDGISEKTEKQRKIMSKKQNLINLPRITWPPGDGEPTHLKFSGCIKPECHDPLNFSEGHHRMPLEFHPINSSRGKQKQKQNHVASSAILQNQYYFKMWLYFCINLSSLCYV